MNRKSEERKRERRRPVLDVRAAFPKTRTRPSRSPSRARSATAWNAQTNACRPPSPTAIQVPIEQLPDLCLDRRALSGESVDEVNRTSWARMGAWLAKRGLALQFHEQVPVHRHRWVGVITAGPLGDEDIDYLVNLLGVTREVIEGREYFNDHCLVMSYDRLVFDPSIGITPPPGLAVREWDPDEITYGISFDKKED